MHNKKQLQYSLHLRYKINKIPHRLLIINTVLLIIITAKILLVLEQYYNKIMPR